MQEMITKCQGVGKMCSLYNAETIYRSSSVSCILVAQAEEYTLYGRLRLKVVLCIGRAQL